jgi:hypothetical protein
MAEPLSAAARMSQAPSTGRMLRPDQLDDLGHALLVIARELWVAKDRLRVLEAVLDAKGIDVSQAVARHQPDDALAAELAAERSRFVGAIMSALCPAVEAAQAPRP